ncbi:MAG: hypothetical protein ABI663_21320 [Chryseolinea sp.]
MKKYTVLAAVLLVVCCMAAAAMALRNINNHDINISFSETDDKLTLSASFPDEDSERVQDYIKTQLKMTDLSDFGNLEIKRYHTPDQKMHFSIKSRDGYIKIVLDKTNNTSASYNQLKKTREGLNTLLTHR